MDGRAAGRGAELLQASWPVRSDSVQRSGAGSETVSVVRGRGSLGAVDAVASATGAGLDSAGVAGADAATGAGLGSAGVTGAIAVMGAGGESSGRSAGVWTGADSAGAGAGAGAEDAGAGTVPGVTLSNGVGAASVVAVVVDTGAAATDSGVFDRSEPGRRLEVARGPS